MTSSIPPSATPTLYSPDGDPSEAPSLKIFALKVEDKANLEKELAARAVDLNLGIVPDLEAQSRDSGIVDKVKEKPELPAVPGENDRYLVTMEARNSQLNPHHWSVFYRWMLTFLTGSLIFNCTFASSAPSNIIPSIAEDFGISNERSTLTLSMFVAGYCVGPLIFGPLSESYGRRVVLVWTFFPYAAFHMASALAPNFPALVVFRFLAGCFASSPLTTGGGILADMWDAETRGDAMAVFSIMPNAGPSVAPLIAGYIYVNGVSWRWMFWILFIFAVVSWLMILFLLPETFTPYILVQEAKRVRKETGDERYYASLERRSSTVMDILKRTILKPFIMFFEEPMLAILTIYLAFVYGVINLMYIAVPIIFRSHGLNAAESGLTFLSVLVGSIVACVIYVYYFNRNYRAVHNKLKSQGIDFVPPEQRLIPLMWCAPLLAISFFWIAFTSYPSISIVSPIFAMGLFGMCILILFMAIFNYLIDTYLMNAASALAINTVIRSAFGAGFPLFAQRMYTCLSVPGATGLLAGIATVFIPIPILLFKYGHKFRAMSKNAIAQK